MIIAFIGCDGSGKTTIARALVKKLKKEGINCEYKHQYGISFSIYFGKWVRKIYKKSMKLKKNKKPSYWKLWPFLIWINLLFDLFWIKFFRRKKIFVFDRYVYDMIISWEMKNVLNPFVKKLLESLPRPDIVFLLDANWKTLYRRKKEEYKSAKECKEKRKKYLEFARKRKIKIISTEKSVQQAKKKIFNELDIFQNYLQ